MEWRPAQCVPGSRQLKLNSHNVCQCHLHLDPKPHPFLVVLISFPLTRHGLGTKSAHLWPKRAARCLINNITAQNPCEFLTRAIWTFPKWTMAPYSAGHTAIFPSRSAKPWVFFSAIHNWSLSLRGNRSRRKRWTVRGWSQWEYVRNIFAISSCEAQFTFRY